ncbi:MAG TPA: 23S rRNA (guanosine(2251)-2'-O)-methyltransferase RlmB, partial [Steroidobacteraceae bacterium]|nr:23S rRNA (guanosine(2251)-2'-O)-methyltransferase RlmB [Steroidobacteraceae bacterium]
VNTSTVFGIHAVRSLLQRAPARLRRLMIDSKREDARIRELLQLAQAAGVKAERVDAKAIAARVGEAAHQGVIAEVESMPAWQEADLLQALTDKRDPLVLLLDGVQDPHNLGACLRTADACGALAVVVPKDRAAGMNATVRKVAAGAAETTPLVSVTNLSRSMKLLKEAGLWIAGADMTGEKMAWQADLGGSLALVMGGEGEGLRDLTRRHCDFVVRLPQVGSVESLNVSVACGMLLYEAQRQRNPD